MRGLSGKDVCATDKQAVRVDRLKRMLDEDSDLLLRLAQ